MDVVAVLSTSNKFLSLGSGGLLSGIVIIIALKKRLIPNLPIKWGIALISLAVGMIFLAVGFMLK